ncbi:hypothetical protein Tco_0195285 [Tanacetum coccineum]
MIQQLKSNAYEDSSGYDVLNLVPSWSLVKCRHRYAVSSLMDTTYRMSEPFSFIFLRLSSRMLTLFDVISTPMDISGKLMANNGQAHWQAIQHVLKYLKKTMDYSLTYTDYPSVLEGYTDASWISNTKDNSSTSGWVFLLGGGAISWASKKQTCITGSIMESEFMALAAAGKEAEWLRNLILEIPLWSKPIAPIFIRCDSAATLAKAYS